MDAAAAIKDDAGSSADTGISIAKTATTAVDFSTFGCGAQTSSFCSRCVGVRPTPAKPSKFGFVEERAKLLSGRSTSHLANKCRPFHVYIVPEPFCRRFTTVSRRTRQYARLARWQSKATRSMCGLVNLSTFEASLSRSLLAI